MLAPFWYSDPALTPFQKRDYTNGQLPSLIDVIINSKTALFVCAVGVPPKWAVEKLHAAGIPVMKCALFSEHP